METGASNDNPTSKAGYSRSPFFIKDKALTPEACAGLGLCMALEPEGSLSFAILDSGKQHYHATGSQFWSPKEPAAAALENAIANTAYLREEYQSVALSISAPASTLVPRELFRDGAEADYLAFNHAPRASTTVRSDFLSALSCHQVYRIPDALLQAVTRHFPQAAICHRASVLIQHMAVAPGSTSKASALVHFGRNFFDLILFRERQLLFHNRFEFETREDVIYYILFVSDQLKLQPDDLSVTLAGAVPEHLEVKALISRYLNRVESASRPEGYSYSPELDALPAHRFTHLYATWLCA